MIPHPAPPTNREGALHLLEHHAFLLFAQRGFAGVSVGQLAEASGLSRGAMYWHFDSKEALFIRCLQRLHALFDAYIFIPMQKEHKGSARLLMMIEGLKAFLKDPLVEKGVAGYWLVEDARFLNLQREFEQRNTALLRETLVLSEQQGSLVWSESIDNLSLAIMALIEAVVLPLRYQNSQQASGVLDALIHTLFKAYGSR
jgi:AcrR family transcriptional regulator